MARILYPGGLEIMVLRLLHESRHGLELDPFDPQTASCPLEWSRRSESTQRWSSGESSWNPTSCSVIPVTQRNTRHPAGRHRHRPRQCAPARFDYRARYQRVENEYSAAGNADRIGRHVAGGTDCVRCSRPPRAPHPGNRSDKMRGLNGWRVIGHWAFRSSGLTPILFGSRPSVTQPRLRT